MVHHRPPWMESSDVIPMFPSLVWKLQLEPGLRDALRTRILAAIGEARPPLLAAGDGWQSDQALHQREDLGDFVACIRNAVATILRFLRIGDEQYEITA